MSAPLLTAELALEAIPSRDVLEALDAIINGRTRCVEVLTEDEHRAAFLRWHLTVPKMPYISIIDAMHMGYMACARANNLVAGEKG